MLKGGRTNVKFINKVILGLYFVLMRNLPFKVLIPLGPGIIHVHPLFFFKLQALAACFTYWFPPLLLSPVFLSGYLASLCFSFFIFKGIGLAWLVKNIFKIYNPLEKISLNLDFSGWGQMEKFHLAPRSQVWKPVDLDLCFPESGEMTVAWSNLRTIKILVKMVFFFSALHFQLFFL